MTTFAQPPRKTLDQLRAEAGLTAKPQIADPALEDIRLMADVMRASREGRLQELAPQGAPQTQSQSQSQIAPDQLPPAQTAASKNGPQVPVAPATAAQSIPAAAKSSTVQSSGQSVPSPKSISSQRADASPMSQFYGSTEIPLAGPKVNESEELKIRMMAGELPFSQTEPNRFVPPGTKAPFDEPIAWRKASDEQLQQYETMMRGIGGADISSEQVGFGENMRRGFVRGIAPLVKEFGGAGGRVAEAAQVTPQEQGIGGAVGRVGAMAPQSAAFFIPGGQIPALTQFAASGAGQRLEELEGRSDLSDTQKITSALGAGISEAATEKIGLGAIGRMFSKVMGGGSIRQIGAAVAGSMGTNIAEEEVNLVAQNAIDAASGVKTFDQAIADVMQNAPTVAGDAALLSLLFSGAAMGARALSPDQQASESASQPASPEQSVEPAQSTNQTLQQMETERRQRLSQGFTGEPIPETPQGSAQQILEIPSPQQGESIDAAQAPQATEVQQEGQAGADIEAGPEQPSGSEPAPLRQEQPVAEETPDQIRADERFNWKTAALNAEAQRVGVNVKEVLGPPAVKRNLSLDDRKVKVLGEIRRREQNTLAQTSESQSQRTTPPIQQTEQPTPQSPKASSSQSESTELSSAVASQQFTPTKISDRPGASQATASQQVAGTDRPGAVDQQPPAAAATAGASLAEDDQSRSASQQSTPPTPSPSSVEGGADKVTSELQEHYRQEMRNAIAAKYDNPRARADAISNSRNIVNFFDSMRKFESGHFQGDRVAFTGVENDGLREFIFLEGHRKGEYGTTTTTTARGERAAQSQQAFLDEQSDFRKLNKPSPEPTAALSPSISASQSGAAQQQTVPAEQVESPVGKGDAQRVQSKQMTADEGAGRSTSKPQPPERPSGESVEQIAKRYAASNSDRAIGFRVLDPTEPYSGEPLKPSRVWQADDKGEFVPTNEEQDGVSTFTNWKDAERYSKYTRGTLLIVAGDKVKARGDEMAGEAVLANPKVVAVARRDKSSDPWVVTEISFDQPAPPTGGVSTRTARTVNTPTTVPGPSIDGDWKQFADESGTLGIARADMPQIKSEHRGALTQFFVGRGIKHTTEEVLPGSLKPTQQEFSTEKVKKAQGFEGPNRAILVSADNHVLDGHHQWVAALNDDPNARYPVIRFDAPITELLDGVREFPSVGYAEGERAATLPQRKEATHGRETQEQGPREDSNQEGVTQETRRQEALTAPVRSDVAGDAPTRGPANQSTAQLPPEPKTQLGWAALRRKAVALGIPSAQLPKEMRSKQSRDRLRQMIGEREGEIKAESVEPPKTTDAPANTPAIALANTLASKLQSGNAVAKETLFSEAKKVFGGSAAGGHYQTKDAYDSLELAVNKFIQSEPMRFNVQADLAAAKPIAADLESFVKALPTQTRRSEETDEFQQFSTPPHYAYAINWLANIDQNDVVIEPSAGVGGIAVHAHNAGAAQVIVNELSPRRVELLQAMGFDRTFTENAEQLNNTLPADVKPTVVVMNPPFSQSAGRMKDKKIQAGAIHMEQAFKRLQPGGRLVAIVGGGLQNAGPEGGMSMSAPSYSKFWKSMRELGGTVMANVRVAGSVYAKYGTTFPTRVIVIDKSASDAKTITGEVESVPQLLELLSEVRDARKHQAQPTPAPSSRAEAPDRGEGDSKRVDAVRAATGAVGDRERQSSDRGTVSTGTERTSRSDVVVEPASGARVSDEDSRAAWKPSAAERSDKRDAGTSGQRDPERPSPATDGAGSELRDSLEVEQVADTHKTARTSEEALYEEYRPQRVRIKGAKKHPSPLSESAAMSAVAPPAVQYRPKLPKSAIESGAVSDAQLEAIVYAGHAHSQMLPSAIRRGFYIGDGTGVGKGRENAAIIWDNWNQGRKKAIWISKSQNLEKSAARDMEGVGWSSKPMFNLKGAKLGTPITHGEGVLYTTYATLASKGRGEEGAGGPSRLDQIVEWFGSDFDGVIVLDEAHLLSNAIASKGLRGVKDAAKQAMAGLEMQKRLPNARIVYASATPATEVGHLAYAERLGLWGEGTSFADRERFINEIQSGGLAAMELVSRDMKAQGQYMSRTLAFRDPENRPNMSVEYEPLEHELNTEQRKIYDELADSWQLVLRNVNEALELTATNENGNVDGRAKGAAYAKFWGAQQRFANSVITAMKLPTLVNTVESDLKAGNSVIIQLVNTNEAQQERAFARMEEDESIEDVDLSPKDMLLRYVENAFPVTQHEEYVDEEGNTKMRPVQDSKGNYAQNPEAVALRDDLLTKLAGIRVPAAPIDFIVDHFGPAAVAEITGRKRRRVAGKWLESGEAALEKRSDSKTAKEIKDFNDGKRRILIFSDKGGTGESFHADRTYKNQQRRAHYLLQAGWRANVAMQGLGRAHRSNQASAPIIRLVSTNLNGEKRFISTIARRLGQLGALSKGQSKTGGGGLFSETDNLEGTEAKDALRVFFVDIYKNNIPGVDMGTFQHETGLTLVDSQGNLKEQLPPMSQFLNRMLALRINRQNELFEHLFQRIGDKVEQARNNGSLDVGVETLHGKAIHKETEQVVYTQPDTGAETKMVKLKVTRELHPVRWDDISRHEPERFYANVRSGKIYAGPKLTTHTDSRGNVAKGYNLRGPGGLRGFESESNLEEESKWKQITAKSEAKQLWDTEVKELPKTKDDEHHLLTGILLPIWDRVPGKPRVRMAVTEAGERLIGREIKEDDVSTVLRNLGIESVMPAWTKEGATALPKVLEGFTLELSNGWRIERRTIDNDQRAEVRGPDYAHHESFQNAGVIIERIGYQSRYFIPIDKPDVFDRLMRGKQVVDVQRGKSKRGGSGGGAMDSPMRDLPAPPDSADARRDVPKVERVAPAPIRDTPSKKLSEIKLDLESGLGKIRVAGPSRAALGTYYPGSSRTVVRYAGDLDTAAHEAAHRLDDLYGIVAEWSTPAKFNKAGVPIPQKSPFDAELRAPIFQQTTRKHYSVVQKRAEGVAEWVRAWVVNPDEAIRLAPKFSTWFIEQVPPKIVARMRSFGDDIRAWAGSSAEARTAANVEMQLEAPTLLASVKEMFSSTGQGEGFKTGWMDRLSAATVDSLAPLWKGWEYVRKVRGMDRVLPSRDLRVLVRTFAGFDRKMDAVMERGPLNAKNEYVKGLGGFDWLLEPLDHSSRKNLEEDMQAVSSLMISQRVVERAQQLDDAVTQIENLITEAAEVREQLKSMKPGEIPTGKHPRERLKEIASEIVQIKKSHGFNGPTEKFPQYVANRKQRMSGTGAGLYSDTAQAMQTVEEMEADPERFAKLQEAAARYRKWANSVLKYARDKGRISSEVFAHITRRNTQYVAMQRLAEDINPELFSALGSSRRLSSVRAVVQRFVGSTKPIQNPYVSLMQQTYTVLKEADRNAALRVMRDALNVPRSMYQGTPLDLDSIGSRAKSGDEDAIKIFVDGKIEHWQFAPDIHRSLKNWGVTEPSNIIYTLLQLPPRIMHDAITHSPPFLVRNVIRDPLYRSVVSRTGSKPWDHFYSLNPLQRQQYVEDRDAFYRHGGGMFGFYGTNRSDYYKKLKQAVKKASANGTSIITMPVELAKAYGKMATGTEIGSRVAEYKKAYEHAKNKLGYDELDAGLYAAHQARDIQDYAVAGTAIRSINKYIIFLNAAIRGLARTATGVKENPARFATRWFAYVALWEMLTYAWNWWSDNEDEYSQLPAYQRDYFWNFKLAPDLWLRIPKPWEMGVLASAVSRGIDAARGKANAFEGWGKSMANALAPVDEQALLGPFKTFGEVLMNYDLFKDRNIVPPWEADLDIERRKGTANASRIGQIIQDAIGTDARLVDHFIASQFGGLGRMGLQASDIGREDRPDAPTRLGISTAGVLSNAPSRSAKDVEWVYEQARKNGQGNHKQLKRLRAMVESYYNATTAAERDKMAAKVRDEGARLRKIMEARDGKLPVVTARR